MFVNTGCADRLTSRAVGSSQPVGSALAVLFVFFLFLFQRQKGRCRFAVQQSVLQNGIGIFKLPRARGDVSSNNSSCSRLCSPPAQTVGLPVSVCGFVFVFVFTA